ncbi:type VII secretion protein EsaA [Sporosarcina sp. Marseille-Q4063]|uniref:type VII secretion protein EsaA n=1 Tax=Sporosarcina sp. Marseille-Q4063 TaxID=2810514 RepID=UPI001BAE58FE|nr:type VII secretion protein EsaA [Sporosarcina sp. Marseille-Q4063]QUW20790.1 type VII secretion protein EsaA [Sporosarcina sp. Marseille-Q4063]
MKKIESKVLLFLCLVLILSGGITYLALHQSSTGKVDDEVLKMTVAIVNEDQGATFDGTEVDFGHEFIKSIERDPSHDWYVVSRGVAENGFENNAYNMMIVIPKDFSEKALSIDEEFPEKINLNYKINATGNKDVVAEAEKTAGAILGDFNRRIIDVYFASVIGNLQDAQANISTIVEKEAVYTNTYKNAVHSPLMQYTSQFENIQDNTQVSKDSFDGLKEILSAFEEALQDDVNSNEDYLTVFNDLNKMHELNTVSLKDFSNQLSSLDSAMHNQELLQQLRNLELANKEIYDQFQEREKENDRATILSEASAIQTYFRTTNEKLSGFNADLKETLESELDEKVAGRLKDAFTDSFDGKDINLTKLFQQPDNNIHEILKRQIAKLPTLSSKDLEGLGLSETSMMQLNNVIAVTDKYNKEFVESPVQPKNSVPLVNQINEIKKLLIKNGVEVTDSVKIPATKKWGQEFTLAIPEAYEVAGVFLTLPGKNERNYTRTYQKHKRIWLQATSADKFGVRVVLKLKEDASNNIDVFQPVTWSWKLQQKNVGEVDLPEPEPEPEDPVDPIDPIDPVNPEVPEAPVNPDLESEDLNPESTENTVGIENNDEGQTEEAIEESIIPENQDDDEISVTDSEDQEDSVETEDSALIPLVPALPIKPEPITIKDNYITHKIMSPLTDDATDKVIGATANTVREYQKALMLYGVYFGLDMESPQLIQQLEQSGLKELATKKDSSLYYLFNKKDIVELLTDYVVGNIKGHVTAQVREQVEGLQSGINEYSVLVADADRNSQQLTAILKDTTEQAHVMNGALEKTLNELMEWRKASIALLEEQEAIASNKNEEQATLISLDGQFSSLLSGSQSLVEQAKGNLQSADGVYQTFDTIDDQAKVIQESGTTLVTQADTLATNMTDKLIENQSFADNFAGVLENSRIGDRPNENLYSFLSNPVESKNAGVISTGNSLPPYFLVLICFIVSLFTAYAISTNDRKRMQKDSFEVENTLVGGNMPITLITASIALVEGLVIGIVSGNLLNIAPGKFLLWVALIVLTMLAMLLVSTYLLRQLKMIGMFVLLIMLSLYLFSTEALGSDFDKLSLASTIRKYSPLQYIESLFTGFAKGVADHQWIIIVLAGLMLLALVANLFVVNRSRKEEGIKDEGVTEAL